MFTQTSLLSHACPEILTLVPAIVQLDLYLLLILQFVLFHPYTVTDLEKILTLFALDTAPSAQFK